MTRDQVRDTFKAFYDACIKHSLDEPEWNHRLQDLNRMLANPNLNGSSEYTAWDNICKTFDKFIDLVTQRDAYKKALSDVSLDSLQAARKTAFEVTCQLYPAYLSELINQLFDQAKVKTENTDILRTAIVSVIQNTAEPWPKKNLTIAKLIRDYTHQHESKFSHTINLFTAESTLGTTLRDHMLQENPTISRLFEMTPSIDASVNRRKIS